MKLTKQLQEEILQAYTLYCKAYLDGDTELFASLLDDDLTGFGTAISQVFLNKKQALDFYKSTASQIVGKAEFRNRQISLHPVDNNILVTEQCDLYVVADENWICYGQARISALFRQMNKGWKLIHQHASFPDLRTEEGEQVAIEKIRSENIELRDAVKRRTIELEEKNRELEVEASLERVRAVAMSMHQPEDMLAVAKLLYKELLSLNFTELRNAIIHIFNDEEGYFHDYDYSSLNGGVISRVPYAGNSLVATFIKQIRQGREAFSELIVEGKQLKDWIKFRKANKQPDDSRLDSIKALYYYIYSVGGGSIGVSTFRSITVQEQKILEKFRNVFDLAYKRFTDISKALAQVREAQVEAAVERVRNKALAMHEPKDLHQVVVSLKKELFGLQIPGVTAVSMYLEQEDGSIRGLDLSTPAAGENDDEAFKMDVKFRLEDTDPDLWVRKIWNSSENYFVIEADEADFKRIITWLYTIDPKEAAVAEKLISELGIKKAWLPTVKLEKGKLNIDLLQPPGPEIETILLKMGAAFDLAYTRFLDLQKAEAQAREAQIEAALERVRARAMGMRSSDELNTLIGTLFSELTRLELVLTRSVIIIYEPDTYTCRWWMANSEDPSAPNNFLVSYHALPFFDGYRNNWLKRSRRWVYELEGDDKVKTDDFLFSETELALLPQHVIEGMKAPGKVWLSASFNAFGCITLASLEPLPDAHFDILLRFAKVFDLSYTRFNDLKQAEAQAREAQIEVALEKVRSRTMAMQKSDELPEAATLLFQQIQSLGMSAWSAGYCIWDEDKQAITLWMSSEGVLQPPFRAPLTKDPSFIHMREAYERGESFFVEEVGGEELVKHYEYMRTLPVVGKILDSIIEKGHPLPTFQIFHLSYFSEGFLLFITYEPVPEAHDIFKRFGNVFDQTYTRFLDLQKAEAQARESKIEASLERVRSKAMSMHSTQDLADTIGAFYRELQLFSITPRRCGVGLLDKENRIGELFTWNTTETGESLELVGRLKMEGHPVLNAVYDHWQSQTEYHPILKGNEIRDYYKIIRPQMPFPDYPHDVVQYGYFFFFPEGGVYAWTEKQMAEEELKIYRRFTSVLSLTYKRHKDLHQAEALALQAEKDLINLKKEKQKTENALEVLKATQKQLIQSEKMASLGELTAGIAHEIQNPLNFVNNFSEVNLELLEELQKAIRQGDHAEAFGTSEEIRQNLEKINQHGKRADGIVKNMLQHSRKTGNEKQSTDLNALVDEFLRLSYHGLRAKDKSFNAIIETHLDPAIGHIIVNAQDIGRVLLNLFSNAFYSVHQKKKQQPAGYEPGVAVSTRKIKPGSDDEQVEIIVKDNGMGIPDKVLDKIYQPFFTTKPTGQGTGLGLSLSYDIITKGHGGEMKVLTEEGKGAEFIIQLKTYRQNETVV